MELIPIVFTSIRRVTRPTLSALWLVLFVLSASPAFSQTVWFKYEGNPVMDVGPPGSWEARGANIFQVMHEDGTYRAWYTGEDGTHRRIGYATSRDGLVWTKFPTPVLDLGADGTWDWREVATGHVLRSGSTYLMWYQGYDGAIARIGYAESKDGVLWTKASDVNPVLKEGPSDFDAHGVGFPFVMDDSSGGFTMWHTGYSEGLQIQIAYVSGRDAISWTKHSSPVLTTGDPGSWEDKVVNFPSVLYDGARYEMWYAGSREFFSGLRIGYATSPDGIHWTKDPGNPVLTPGPPGSWDDVATPVGAVLLEGDLYRMWYIGFDGAIDRTGYAISPRGAQVYVSADGRYVAPGKDSVFIRVRVEDPSDLSFTAEIVSRGDHRADFIELLDDGAHDDGLPGDGFFANRWLPSEERNYAVKLNLRVRGENDLGFQLDNAASFTSIGPVKLDRVEFVSDAAPHPGDTVVIKLALKNHGSSVAADSISATISTADRWVTVLSLVSPEYGTIGTGGSATTGGHYRFFVSPNCPVDTDIPFDVQISSAGISRWHDRFVVSVLPPWWRSNWAYALYALAVLGLLYGIRRADMARVRFKHQREMERFQLEKLKELDELKSRFFANISHEFRTPLTLIEGPARQIFDGDGRPDTKENAGMILKNARRLLTLVNQLLDLSKIDSGQMKLQAEETDIVELVREIAAAFESLAKFKAIEFCINCPEELIVGWVDRDAVEKILTNLLSNAFKFTPAGGSVDVRVDLAPPSSLSYSKRGGSEGGRIIQIVVSDTGIGIPSDQIDKLFDRFYQVDQSQTREFEGTGIGLALTKELVELHKGEITVESEVGKGTSLIVRLPVERGHFAEEETAEPSQPATLWPRPEGEDLDTPPSSAATGEPGVDDSLPLVLIIEDNADMRKYMRGHLEGEYRLGEAVNGEEGVQKAIECVPDLVISDVMMPKMDGFELCRKLKTDERTSHIPIILLTAKAAGKDKLEGLETGADDYVTKPFDARELLVRVKNLIEQRRRLQKKYSRMTSMRPSDICVASVDEQFLRRALNVAETHIADRDFSTGQFAEEMFLSKMQLHRKITALTGRSPWEFFRIMRLERAAQLLRKRAGTMAEIADQIGYDAPSHFAEAFRKHFGVTPSDFSSGDGDSA